MPPLRSDKIRQAICKRRLVRLQAFFCKDFLEPVHDQQRWALRYCVERRSQPCGILFQRQRLAPDVLIRWNDAGKVLERLKAWRKYEIWQRRHSCRLSLACQSWNESGEDKRALAAAGGTNHRHKSTALQKFAQFIDESRSPEKESPGVNSRRVRLTVRAGGIRKECSRREPPRRGPKPH